MPKSKAKCKTSADKVAQTVASVTGKKSKNALRDWVKGE